MDPWTHPPAQALGLLAAGLLLQALLRLIPAAPEGVAGVLPALSFLCLVGPAWWLAQRAGHDPLRVHGVLVPLRGLAPAAALTVPILGLFGLIVVLVARAQGLAPRDPSWGDLAWFFLIDALLVALPEEWLFRGVLQPALERPEGPRRRVLGAPLGRGALVGALLFGLAHALLWLSPARALTAAPGLLFAWLRARTGGILPAVVAHAACNALLALLVSAYPDLRIPGAG